MEEEEVEKEEEGIEKSVTLGPCRRRAKFVSMAWLFKGAN